MSLSSPIIRNQVEIKNYLSPKNEEELRELARKSYQVYQNSSLAQRKGSVDLNPVFWTSHVCSTIDETLKKNPKAITAEIGNGCCTLPECPLAVFFQIVVDTAQKPGETTQTLEETTQTLEESN